MEKDGNITLQYSITSTIICCVKILSALFYMTALEDSESEDSSCNTISIKDVYSATNNLNALNFIGQGIAGENSVTWR